MTRNKNTCGPHQYFFSHLYLKESFIVQDCISTDKWMYMHSISSSNVFGERNPLSNWPVYLQREERTCGNVAWVRMVIDMVLHLKKIQNMFLYDKGWIEPNHLRYFALKWSILWYHINFSSNISISIVNEVQIHIKYMFFKIREFIIWYQLMYIAYVKKVRWRFNVILMFSVVMDKQLLFEPKVSHKVVLAIHVLYRW